jgi:hypothetical protein
LPGDEVRYRSPEEIALQNAADALGVSLGDDYPDELDLPGHSATRTAEPENPARLDASREELLAYIQGVRSKRRRKRRRRRLRAAIALMAVAAVVLVLFENERFQPISQNGKASGWKLPQGVWAKLSPPRRSGRSIANPRVRSTMTEITNGVEQMVLSAYLDLRDEVCMSTTQLIRSVVKSQGGGGCTSSSRLLADLSHAPAIYVGLVAYKRYVLLKGYARPNLKRIVARTMNGRVETKIGGTWNVSAKGGRQGFSIKAFMVRIRYGDGISFKSALNLASDTRPIDFTAVFGNGKVSRIVNSGELRRNRNARGT